MRRTVLIASLIAAAFVGAFGVAGPAHAVDDPASIPFGEMASPATASAGAPMWVKSITPCPAVPEGWWGYVAVSIHDQEQPQQVSPLAAVDADLFPDGSWRATISAPSSAPAGPTASYFVGARCIITNENPDPNKPDVRSTIPTQGYFARPLLITSTGHGSFTGGGPPDIPGTATTTTTTSTTTSTSTTTTTIASAGLHTSSFTPDYRTSDYQPKLDGEDDGVSLNAQAASGSRSEDSGSNSNVGGFLLFIAVLAGLGAGGWQLSRFTKR